MLQRVAKVSRTTVIKTENLANIIATKDRNDFKQVTGLQYFCGGEERHPEYPNHICARDVRQWLRDIKNRTPSQNLNDEDRLELTKHYSLGLVRDYLQDTSMGIVGKKLRKIFRNIPWRLRVSNINEPNVIFN